MPYMTCTNCGDEVPRGVRFCGQGCEALFTLKGFERKGCMTQREERLMAEVAELKARLERYVSWEGKGGRMILPDWYEYAREIFARIAHGDDEHRAWLKTELDRWAEAKDGR